MANLYGVYKAGKATLEAAHRVNSKRLAAGAATTTTTAMTGAGVLGGEDAGSLKGEMASTRGKLLMQQNKTESDLNSQTDFATRFGNALKEKLTAGIEEQ